MLDLVVYGCGGHARSIADTYLFDHSEGQLLFVDPNAKPGEKIFGFDAVKTTDESAKCILALGDDNQRRELFEQLGLQRLVSVISSRAYIGREAKIGQGCFVAHDSHIGPQARIGSNSIINTQAIVEHEVSIGQHCQISPNVTIGGRTSIGDRVFVGLGATVLNRLKICSDVTIGAGTVVTKDIQSPGSYIGIPAQRLKK